MMKKFFILLVTTTALVIAGCSMKETSRSVNVDAPSMMTLVEITGYYKVVVDNVTRVMYILNNSGGITVMINTDGTPRIWEGRIGD